MATSCMGRHTAFMSMMFLTTSFFFVKIIVGYATNSTASVTDSFHMLSDIISLFVGYFAMRMANRSCRTFLRSFPCLCCYCCCLSLKRSKKKKREFHEDTHMFRMEDVIQSTVLGVDQWNPAELPQLVYVCSDAYDDVLYLFKENAKQQKWANVDATHTFNATIL